MKRSHVLNLIAAMVTLLLALNWVSKTSGTICFNRFDYATSFGTLFLNIGTNIYSVFER